MELTKEEIKKLKEEHCKDCIYSDPYDPKYVCKHIEKINKKCKYKVNKSLFRVKREK